MKINVFFFETININYMSLTNIIKPAAQQTARALYEDAISSTGASSAYIIAIFAMSELTKHINRSYINMNPELIADAYFQGLEEFESLPDIIDSIIKSEGFSRITVNAVLHAFVDVQAEGDAMFEDLVEPDLDLDYIDDMDEYAAEDAWAEAYGLFWGYVYQFLGQYN